MLVAVVVVAVGPICLMSCVIVEGFHGSDLVLSSSRVITESLGWL